MWLHRRGLKPAWLETRNIVGSELAEVMHLTRYGALFSDCVQCSTFITEKLFPNTQTARLCGC